MPLLTAENGAGHGEQPGLPLVDRRHSGGSFNDGLFSDALSQRNRRVVPHNEEVRERTPAKSQKKRSQRRYNKRAHAAESSYGNVKLESQGSRDDTPGAERKY